MSPMAKALLLGGGAAGLGGGAYMMARNRKKKREKEGTDVHEIALEAVQLIRSRLAPGFPAPNCNLIHWGSFRPAPPRLVLRQRSVTRMD